jgi:hypothetical protein
MVGVLDYNQLVTQIFTYIVFGGLVAAGVFVGTTKTKLKGLKSDIGSLKEQTGKDIKSSSDLVKSDLEGKIKVLEQQLKDYKENLDVQRNDILEQSRYLRDIGNRITAGKLGDANE